MLSGHRYNYDQVFMIRMSLKQDNERELFKVQNFHCFHKNMVISLWLSFSALLFQISTYALGDLAIVVGVHQLEGLLVLGLLPRELLPGQHAVAVLVVRREHLVHVLSSENKRQHQQLFSMRPKRLIHILRLKEYSNIRYELFGF